MPLAQSSISIVTWTQHKLLLSALLSALLGYECGCVLEYCAMAVCLSNVPCYRANISDGAMDTQIGYRIRE